ncbi:hypothetical protein GJAV_G00252890 [Gymnothorax javanicus]|nr:hypothetical protein GJAV_G00252890 [Gymnothorax javanicus]
MGDYGNDGTLKRPSAQGAVGAPKRKKLKSQLSTKMDRLAADMEQMKALLLNLQPVAGDLASQTSEHSSRSSAQSSQKGTEASSKAKGTIICTALDAQVDDSTCDICDALLQAFAFKTKELGWLMSTMVHACHHVWLVQSPLPEATRKARRQTRKLTERWEIFLH